MSIRKTSISQSGGGVGYGLASPTTTRQGARRREPSEPFPFSASSLASPGASKFPRDEPHATPPPALLRRRTDYKEAGVTSASEDRQKDKQGDDNLEGAVGTGALKRTTTAPLSAGLNGLPSPWSVTPQTAGFSPMGTFGSFGMGNTGQPSATVEKRAAIGGLRGESRFKGLMSKDGFDEQRDLLLERTSLTGMRKVNEAEEGSGSQSWMEARLNRPTSNDTDPFPGDDMRSGSSALRMEGDSSPPRNRGFGTPIRQDSKGQTSFFSMNTDSPAIHNMIPGRDTYQHFTPQQRVPAGTQEPMSPTDTNPYQSPDHERTDADDLDTDGSELHDERISGLGGFNPEQGVPAGFGSFGGFGVSRMSGSHELNPADRSQSSSTWAIERILKFGWHWRSAWTWRRWRVAAWSRPFCYRQQREK